MLQKHLHGTHVNECSLAQVRDYLENIPILDVVKLLVISMLFSQSEYFACFGGLFNHLWYSDEQPTNFVNQLQ